jgi:cytochrome d ubiquinol oxidase subunit II
MTDLSPSRLSGSSSSPSCGSATSPSRASTSGSACCCPSSARPPEGRRRRRDSEARRVMLNTIGPVWDGNEVWLLTAGGAMFAAFPQWYATLFSASTSPWPSSSSPSSCAAWAWTTAARSTTTRGARAGTCHHHRLVRRRAAVGRRPDQHRRGSPIGPTRTSRVTTSSTATCSPCWASCPCSAGSPFVGLFLTHGAFFIALKTDGPIRRTPAPWASRPASSPPVLAVVCCLLAINLRHGSLVSWIGTVVAAVALLGRIFMATKGREGWAFLGTFVTASPSLSWPTSGRSSRTHAHDPRRRHDLTLAAASSTPKTLKIMTVGRRGLHADRPALQGWTYWVFRKRIWAPTTSRHRSRSSNATASR